MAAAQQIWIFVSGENARLNELIAQFGGTSEIARIDSDAFCRNAGKLISEAVSNPYSQRMVRNLIAVKCRAKRAA
jgi:hypothetical protein